MSHRCRISTTFAFNHTTGFRYEGRRPSTLLQNSCSLTDRYRFTRLAHILRGSDTKSLRFILFLFYFLCYLSCFIKNKKNNEKICKKNKKTKTNLQWNQLIFPSHPAGLTSGSHVGVRGRFVFRERQRAARVGRRPRTTDVVDFRSIARSKRRLTGTRAMHSFHDGAFLNRCNQTRRVPRILSQVLNLSMTRAPDLVVRNDVQTLITTINKYTYIYIYFLRKRKERTMIPLLSLACQCSMANKQTKLSKQTKTKTKSTSFELSFVWESFLSFSVLLMLLLIIN